MRNSPNIFRATNGLQKSKCVGESTGDPIFRVVNYGKEAIDFVSEVFRGEKIGCEVEGFNPSVECDMLVKELQNHQVDESYLDGTASKILESQHNRQSEPDLYFKGANSHPLLDTNSFNSTKFKLLAFLQKALPHMDIEIARDSNRDAHYNPAIIREFLNSLELHNDLGSREGKGWDPIERVTKQWAFVIKLSECEGGNTFLYNKQWSPEDERFFNTEDNYSYDMKVVEGVEEFEIEGAKGSLIIFDCTRYHRVQKVLSGRRYSMGGFIGLLEDENKLVIWS